jgi:hypothetical protein
MNNSEVKSHLSFEQYFGSRVLYVSAFLVAGTVSISSVYLAGLFQMLDARFYPFLDASLIYKSLHEVTFYLAFTSVYFRLGFVQILAMSSNSRRREAARKRYRSIKRLPPIVSKTSRPFVRILVLLVSILLFIGLFVMVMSKFLEPYLSLLWLATNVALIFLGFWAISRINSSSARNIKSMKSLWISLRQDRGLQFQILVKKRGFLSVATLIVLLSVMTLGGHRFNTLARQPQLCIITKGGHKTGAILFISDDGFIINTSGKKKVFGSARYSAVFLSKSEVLSVSQSCGP